MFREAILQDSSGLRRENDNLIHDQDILQTEHNRVHQANARLLRERRIKQHNELWPKPSFFVCQPFTEKDGI
ncbi:hypothetical protein RhiirA4_478268 [Rhizophagus irregularis]|uniref:Uncharacterized protein n=1 Tax=Rhizophagus irregularis TaxID=588596 RepID=A0A2I1HEP8_9GLOM|nr:hypothetical protein RhiirA4_478268 [Rhizophagus irregularis]